MMKTGFFIIVIMMALTTLGFSQKKNDSLTLQLETKSADTLEYRLIILDPGFETWLAVKPAMNFYSDNYYLQRNRLYVTEWNLRFLTSNDNGLYDNYIDYNPNTDYGIELNYRLYYYFRYFEEMNHIKLLNSDR